MSKIMLIDENGKRFDNISYDEAKIIAQKKGMSLKLVNSQRQVYRIIDQGKINYEKKRKRKKQLAQCRAQKIKEIQISPTIGNNDLEIKMSKVDKFLSKGLKTKIVMKFKNRQLAYKNDGMSMIMKIADSISQSGKAVLENNPKFEGKKIILLLNPPK